MPTEIIARRVLIVENDPDQTALLKHLLNNPAYCIVGTSATGAGALRLADETRPDVVLMDIGLDGPMTGIETTARLNIAGAPNVVLMSASTQSEMLDSAKLAGATGFLAKPITQKRLRDAIDQSKQMDTFEMTSHTDHDLLVRLDTKLDMVSIQLTEARLQVAAKADLSRLEKLEVVVDGIKGKVLMATGALAVGQIAIHLFWKG